MCHPRTESGLAAAALTQLGSLQLKAEPKQTGAGSMVGGKTASETVEASGLQR